MHITTYNTLSINVRGGVVICQSLATNSTIKFSELDEDYQSCSCLNLNSCVSDNLLDKTLVLNKYLHESPLSQNKEEVEKYAAERRNALQLKSNDKLLLMGAYITEPDYERFKKYPEVMMVDCTHGTNAQLPIQTSVHLRNRSTIFLKEGSHLLSSVMSLTPFVQKNFFGC